MIETAKFNVITAYSSQEAIDTLRKFPLLDGVVTDSGMSDMVCDTLIGELKAVRPDMPVIVVRTPRGSSCDRVDFLLDSFNPTQLLELLQSLQPEVTKQIEIRTRDLSTKEMTS